LMQETADVTQVKVWVSSIQSARRGEFKIVIRMRGSIREGAIHRILFVSVAYA
jgi:hypothetical protein